MSTSIERTVAPVADPVSLSEVKAHLRVNHTDEDDYIDGLTQAAVSLLDGDGELGRAMITQTWAQWFPQSPGWVRLSMGPFQSLVSVEYYDTESVLQTATLTDFETRKDRDFVLIKPKTGFNWPNAEDRADAIKITYVAGFGDASADVPAGLRQALFLLIGHWYEHRESASAVSLHEAPMAVNALLNRERVGWYG